MNRTLALILSAAIFTLGLVVAAADWPQWRGPHRDGISKETGLLQQWPEGGPKLLWQVQDLDGGYATPAVAGNRLFVLGNKGMDDEFVQAREVSDGKTAWTTHIGNVGPNQMANYPAARSTPTVDGDRLYALGSDGDLACLETASGKIVWHKNLRSDFGGKTGAWAYAESPLIDGDKLVCTPGGADATIVALNKKTGETIWKSALPEADEAAYASITIVEAGGVKQYVQLLAKGLAGLDAKTGKLLWRYEKIANSPNIPTPVSRNQIVYSGTAKGGAGAVRLTASGSGVEAKEAYNDRRLPTAIGGAVEVNGYLYGTTQALTCADFATGEIKWQDRCVGPGSVLYADGRLYVHASKSNEVALVEATPEAYREQGRFTPAGAPAPHKGEAWSYPVVANGRLYIRDWNCLWCYDVKAN